MEFHAGEVAKMRAAHKAEMDHLEGVHQRIRSGMAGAFQSGDSSTSADIAALKKSIDELTIRINNIERLLIIHDNILKDGKK